MAQIHQKTETSVANEALSCLKQPALIHIDADQTNAKRIVVKHFASVRDALLREYPWNFASTRALLQAQVEKPVFGFAYMYAFPHDCMAVRDLPDARSKDEWKVEKRAIVTDLQPPLKIIYTRFAYEVAIWDSIFRFAFARQLAVACGPELSADIELIQKAQEEADSKLKLAFPSDAAEGTPEELPDGDWITSRWC